MTTIFIATIVTTLSINTIALYLWNTKKQAKLLKELNYWLKLAHDKENEVNNLKLRVMELYRK